MISPYYSNCFVTESCLKYNYIKFVIQCCRANQFQSQKLGQLVKRRQVRRIIQYLNSLSTNNCTFLLLHCNAFVGVVGCIGSSGTENSESSTTSTCQAGQAHISIALMLRKLHPNASGRNPFDGNPSGGWMPNRREMYQLNGLHMISPGTRDFSHTD